MNRLTTLLALSALLVGMVALAPAEPNEKPVNWNDLPEPYHTPSSSNRPQVVDRPDGAELGLPDGFKVEEFASHEAFIRPRFMKMLPNKQILLSDSGDRGEPNGAIYQMSPDGKKIEKVVGGLDRPYGIELHGNWLYVGSATSVIRYPFNAKQVKVTGDAEELYSMKDFGSGHWTRSLLFNADHSKLYWTIGSGSNVDTGEAKERATVMRMDPDGSNPEIFAEGLRNTIGFTWRPGSEDLWGSVQERDGLGDNLVSDYLVNIKQGKFYGWPYAYSGPHEEPRHKGVAPDKVKETQYPDVLLGAHVAVLDILFYTGDQFPDKYKGGLFMAFHGSWNRADRVGYRITYIPFKDGRPQSGPQDFLTGWMLDPDDRQVWGRPVGLMQMPDGSLLVTDDGANKVWRISHGM